MQATDPFWHWWAIINRSTYLNRTRMAISTRQLPKHVQFRTPFDFDTTQVTFSLSHTVVAYCTRDARIVVHWSLFCLSPVVCDERDASGPRPAESREYTDVLALLHTATRRGVRGNGPTRTLSRRLTPTNTSSVCTTDIKNRRSVCRRLVWAGPQLTLFSSGFPESFPVLHIFIL